MENEKQNGAMQCGDNGSGYPTLSAPPVTDGLIVTTCVIYNTGLGQLGVLPLYLHMP